MTRFRDQIEIFDCVFTITDIDSNTITDYKEIQAPRLFLERYFISLVLEAKNNPRKTEVMISRKLYVEGCKEPLLLFIAYQNWQ